MKIIPLLLIIVLAGLYLLGIYDLFSRGGKAAKDVSKSVYKGTKSTAKDIKKAFQEGITEGVVKEYHDQQDKKK